jgi:hypothetical protein
VIEALGVQRAVNDQMGVVRDQRDALRRRFGLDHRRAENEVGAEDRRVVVGKCQHVGRVVLATEVAVEGQAFVAVDDPHRDLGRHGERGADPARDVGAGDRAAMARVDELERKSQRRPRRSPRARRRISGLWRRPRHTPRRCARRADGARRRPT